jgi:site-specific DNA-adenine methylase
MWSYYGAKTNLVKKYPAPTESKIIEPFAGSARYALEYFDRDVLLVDSYDVIVRIWKWLQQCSPKDVLSVPIPPAGKTTDDLQYDCIEAKWFVGFVIHFSTFYPGKKVSPHFLINRPNGINYTLNRISSNLWKIRHWKIFEGSFSHIPNQRATWFIDPPYQHGGHRYVKSNKNLDYGQLARWCKERGGQVIVCENIKSDWMDFRPLAQQYTHNGTQIEAIWTKESAA